MALTGKGGTSLNGVPNLEGTCSLFEWLKLLGPNLQSKQQAMKPAGGQESHPPRSGGQNWDVFLEAIFLGLVDGHRGSYIQPPTTSGQSVKVGPDTRINTVEVELKGLLFAS